jgi:signal transduction histidine kinase
VTLQVGGLVDARVNCDRDRVLQVLANLVGNAIKFTPAGGRVTLSAAQSEGRVVFSVADTGQGIAADALPHIFDRYWQAARRSQKRGIGLGLSIAHGIVTAHGGKIWVESTPGQGSTFFFEI